MGRRGAHLKHVLHVSDAGRVDVQQLVERIRVLPSPKGGMGSGRHAKRRRAEACGWLREACGGHPAGGLGRSRTANMYRMLVTLEVSKVSGWLNAAAPCRVQREAC